MKKLLSVAIGGVVLLAAALAVVSYKEGWFSKLGAKSEVASGGRGGPSAGEAAASGPGAGNPSTRSASATAGQAGRYKAPRFDGNVAALDWGGKVESVTGVSNEDESEKTALNDLIDGNKETTWTSPHDTAGPKEIVVSFVDH